MIVLLARKNKNSVKQHVAKGLEALGNGGKYSTNSQQKTFLE